MSPPRYSITWSAATPGRYARATSGHAATPPASPLEQIPAYFDAASLASSAIAS
jgi:hypothetical protein